MILFNFIKRSIKLIFKTINYSAYILFCTKQVKDNYIVLESEGDCSDNAFALFHYMYSHDYQKKYKIIWLVEHPNAFHNKKNIKYIKKNSKGLQLVRNYYLAICKYYIYDHCNMKRDYPKRSAQKIIYLCHGYAGFKAPKGEIGLKFKSYPDEIYTTGVIPKQGLIDYLNVRSDQIFLLGFSRLDWFYSDLTQVNRMLDEKYSLYNYNKVFLWMPTYRKCDNVLFSEDYLNNETGLPLFNMLENMREFDNYLGEKRVLFVLKLHHLQSDMAIFKNLFTNIIIMKDKDLSDLGIQLYQFIPKMDCLVTDYSSISTDYLLLNKPIIYILDDYEEYNKSRGIYPANALELMPGYHVYNVKELKKAIEDVSEDKDIYACEREQIVGKFHKNISGGASERILKHLEIGNEQHMK